MLAKLLIHLGIKWSDRQTFCNHFYKNQSNGFVVMVILKFYNGSLWQPPFYLASHETKIEKYYLKNTNLHHLAHFLHLRSEQDCFNE